MHRGVTVAFVALVCANLFGQSPTPTTNGQTFSIKGTLTDPVGAVIPGAKVSFHGTSASKTVSTNDAGRYEADLPFGVYTMSAQSPGFRMYRRPPFRVTSKISVSFDIILPVEKYVDPIVISSSGAATPDEEGSPSYYGEESFPAASEDGVPFQVYIRYMTRATTDSTYIYSGEKTPYEDPVFMAYNLFSLQADQVTYHAKSRTVEASGNVVFVKESGALQRASSITLKIENGHAIPLQ